MKPSSGLASNWREEESSDGVGREGHSARGWRAEGGARRTEETGREDVTATTGIHALEKN